MVRVSASAHVAECGSPLHCFFKCHVVSLLLTEFTANMCTQWFLNFQRANGALW